jgi:pimeloyl-ACP methyl ester carboxylesterase
MTTSGTLRLADGRTLTYADAGDPDGYPVFLAHGFPGSRLEANVVDEAAAAAGVRLLCPDRPGFGGSDPQPARGLGDWPADVAALANRLGIGRFAVLGFSAGGPYALACAALLRERVNACATVSSPGPLDQPGSTNGMATINRVLFGAGRRVPMLAGLVVRLIARSARGEPAAVARRMGQGMAPSDQRLLGLAPIGPAYGEAIREAFRQGPGGPIVEAALLARPWSFLIDQISAPTIVWHGKEDLNVPPAIAVGLTEVIPGAELRLIAESGHLLFLERAASILGTVRETANT